MQKHQTSTNYYANQEKGKLQNDKDKKKKYFPDNALSCDDLCNGIVCVNSTELIHQKCGKLRKGKKDWTDL